MGGRPIGRLCRAVASTSRSFGATNRTSNVPIARTIATFVCVTALVALSGCLSSFEVPVETPVPATLDVSPFSRVLVAGFLGAGIEEVDANVETARLLRSQLRMRSSLKVIEGADVLPLLEIAAQSSTHIAAERLVPAASRDRHLRKYPRTETDLKAYDHIFTDVAFWKRLGEEYDRPVILTGSVLFTVESRAGVVQRGREIFDGSGRRRLESTRQSVQRTVHSLKPRFIFIDGRTGTLMYSERFHEQASSDESRNVPALSAYFQLMDRILPTVLGTLSHHKVRSFRTLLK